MCSCIWEPAYGEDGLWGLGMHREVCGDAGTGKLQGDRKHSLRYQSPNSAAKCTGTLQAESRWRHKPGRVTNANKQATNTSRQKCKRSWKLWSLAQDSSDIAPNRGWWKEELPYAYMQTELCTWPTWLVPAPWALDITGSHGFVRLC